VEITLLAVKGERRVLTTPQADGSPGRTNPNLSSAVLVGDRLFLSGMLGNTEANRGNARGQSQETLARLGRTLKAAGFDWSHVVDGVVYLTDPKDFAEMNAAWREVFTTAPPARATVRTGLVAPDGVVEIMLTAVK
jgi:2-iminobutanoate/2-iminopropanoate deaminase